MTIGQRDVCNKRRRAHRVNGPRLLAGSALIAFLAICQSDARAQSLQPFPNYPDLPRAIAIQSANQPGLLATEGVQGVGVGQTNGNLVLVVLVDTTNNASQLPPSLDGLPVTVQAVGRIHSLVCAGDNPQLTYPPPVPLGVSGGNALPFLGVSGSCASGTIGFKVRDNTSGAIGWISNSHVVAGGTNGCAGGAPLGTPEYQPGPIDTTPTCSPGQLVGTLNRFVPVDFNGGGNEVDAGFVQSSDLDVSSEILNLGPQVNNVVPAFAGQSVQKEGRTTACTEGTVNAINVTINITGDGPSCALETFTNQILVLPASPSTEFGAPGDSGSPVVDADNNAVGLLFAGDNVGDAYANPIGALLSALNVSLASSANSQVITRSSRFWFTHGYNLTETNCATLLAAIQANGSVMNLGFVNLPTANRNADNVIDAFDTIIEALSFYWRSSGVTGEPGGTQGEKLKASSLCVARKRLAVELIAATANASLLGTFPGNATYVNGGVQTKFPPDLIPQAQTVAAGFDAVAIQSMTALLEKFNNSGVTNNLPNGLVECSSQSSKILKKESRDPMLQDTCPGVNNSCSAAQAVIFPNSTNEFASAAFTATVNLGSYSNNMPSPACGTGGGPDAVWQITPDVGINGRQFTVSTAGSNFSTMIGVWSGSCGGGASSNSTGSVSNGLVAVNCAVNSIGLEGATLTFNTDGTNNFFIVGEGISGQFGKLKIRITSP